MSKPLPKGSRNVLTPGGLPKGPVSAGVKSVLGNALRAVQASGAANDAANRAKAAATAAGQESQVKQAVAAANKSVNAAKAVNAANVIVQVKGTPGEKKVAAKANNMAQKAAKAAVAAVNGVPPPPPPPPPKRNNNGNREPSGDGKYTSDGRRIWQKIDGMIAKLQEMNVVQLSNATTKFESLKTDVANVKNEITGVQNKFKAEVSEKLGQHPSIKDSFKHLSECKTNTNNRSGACPKIRNMDMFLKQIDNAIQRSKNMAKLNNAEKRGQINNANAAARRAALQAENNRRAAEKQKRNNLKSGINALVDELKEIQKKI